MSILRKLSFNLSDIANFGPQFLRRHLPKITGAELAKVKLPGGQSVYLRAGESDAATIRQTFSDHQYRTDFNKSCAARVQQRYDDILASGQVPSIIDAGANIGAASIWFADHYPRAEIVAIEPEPGNFAVLKKNTAAMMNIKPVQAAIGSRPGYVKVMNDELGWAAKTERSSAGVRIMTMAEAFEGGMPFIAKVDIEGFEGDLFSANTEWLKESFVVFIEPHDWLLPDQGTSRAFQAALGREDFEIYISGEILTYVRRS